MNCVVENKYKIEKFTSPNSKNWDCLISAARNGSFLFFRDYMDYHSTRFIDESVLVFSGQRVIAVFPCNREGSTAVSHGGLTYGGLISGMDVGASDVLVIFEELESISSLSVYRKCCIKLSLMFFTAIQLKKTCTR